MLSLLSRKEKEKRKMNNAFNIYRDNESSTLG